MLSTTFYRTYTIIIKDIKLQFKCFIMKIDDFIECYPHKKSRLRYHIILVTKNHKRCLNAIRKEVFAVFRDCESKSDIKFIE